MSARFIVILLLATALPSLAQKLPSAPNASDAKGRQGKWVILFDNKWKELTTADHAEFYRLITYLDDKPVGVVEDHFRTGKLQFNSKLVADRPKNLYDGEATWYYETGAKRITVAFDQGKFVRRVGAWLRNGTPATDDITTLNDRGNELTSEGKAAEAEVAFQVALENVEAMYSKHSPTYLVVYRNLIDALFAQEKYKKAADFSQELVSLDLDVLPAADPAPVDDISYWSTAAQLSGASQGELTKIESLGVEEGRKRGKPESYYHMLVDLGTNYKNQEKIAQALPLLEEAWVSKKLEADQMYELLVYSLAGIYSEGQRYKESVAVYREAQAVFQRSPDHALLAQSMLVYMAIDLQLSGDRAGALKAYREELEMMQTKGKGESFNAAQTLSNIGLVCSEMGQLLEAEKALLHAETIFERSPETTPQDRQTLYSALQTVYENLGNKEKANAYDKKLIAIGRQVNAGSFDPFTSMLEISVHLNKHNMITVRKKLTELLRSMESRSNLTLDERRLYSSLVATSGTLRIRELDSLYNSLGSTGSERLARYDGELKTIAATYRKGLALQKNDTTVGGKQLQTMILFQLALVYEKLNINTDSVVTATMMNAWRYYPKASKTQIELLANCASLSQLNYTDSKSITDLYRVIFQLLQMYRQQTLPYLSESGQSGYLKTSRYLLDNFISFAVEESEHNPDIAGFLYDEVLRNKGLILHSLSQTRQLIAEGKDSNLLKLFDQWKQLKNDVALASGMDEMTRKSKHINLATLQQQSEDAETRLAAASAEFRKYKVEQVVSWKDIAAKLKPGEAAVEIVRAVVTDYDRKDSIYAALVLKPGSKPVLVRIPNASTMEHRMLKAYRNSIKFKTTAGVPDSYKMYWSELAKGLAGTTKVYFSPDGVYHLISIPSLYNTSTKKYLVDEIDVQLVSSTAALLATQPGNTEWKRGIVLFGSPDFGSAQASKSQSQDRSMSLDNVMPLPGAEKELGDVGKLFEASSVPFREYVAGQATEAQLKSVENPYVLHIATHGYFIQDATTVRPDVGSVSAVVREDPMLRSGLLLAQCCNGSRGSGPQSEDGVLTAYEASTLSLGKTQLVVLSACDTGLGEVSFGEGVYGLQRAFLESGAASMVMSLWKVDDAATQQLMTEFYREWLKGKSAHEALRAAQQKLRVQFPEPYYWAGFVAVRR